MSFEQFTNQIPNSEYMNTKVFMGERVAIFKPKNFLSGTSIDLKDFHFSLPVLTPPTIYIGKRAHDFKKGKLLVFQPGIDISISDYAPCKEYFTVNVDKEFLLDIASEITGKRTISLKNPENYYSIHLINDIIGLQYEIESFQNQCPVMIQSISTQLAIQLLREIFSNNSIDEVKAIPDGNYVKRAVDYMEAYYNSNITIDDICKTVHISRYHFIRMFKEKIGSTPHEYLVSIRIRKAKELLERRELSVGEAAEQCGFINQGHFSSVFKQYTGVSPSEYKRKYFII